MNHMIIPPYEPKQHEPVRPPMIYIEKKLKWEYKQIARNLKKEKPLDEAELLDIVTSVCNMESRKTKSEESWYINYKELDTKEFPEEKWLIDKLIPELTCGIIGGASGVRKTWLLLDIATSVASGKKVVGNFSTLSSGNVLYVAGEESAQQIKISGLFSHLSQTLIPRSP